MKQKIFEALDVLKDTAKAYDAPILFDFVINQIDSIAEQLDDDFCQRDLELVIDRWSFDSVIYYKDSFSIFCEKYKQNDDSFDDFLQEYCIVIDGNLDDTKNGFPFDKAIMYFANYLVEQEVRSFFHSFFKKQAANW